MTQGKRGRRLYQTIARRMRLKRGGSLTARDLFPKKRERRAFGRVVLSIQADSEREKLRRAMREALALPPELLEPKIGNMDWSRVLVLQRHVFPPTP